jgi:guanylate kinase
MARQGILVVLSGPSGAGKGTICKELLQHHLDLHYSISATTRLPRDGEVNGVNYWFTTPAQFRAMVENDELLEWAEVYGNYYGTPRSYVRELLHKGGDVVLEIDTQGAMQVKAKFPQGVFVYILPPSLDELVARINKRGTDSPETVKQRLGCVKVELSYAYQYNYLVINDEVAKATAQVAAIISAERTRVDRNTALIDAICQRGSID